jgi:signal transduction histidine kinase
LRLSRLISVGLLRQLRVRVGIALVLLGGALIAAQALIVSRLVEQQEDEFINEILSDEMDRLVATRGANLSDRLPLGRISGYVARNEAERTHMPAPVRALGPGMHEVYIDNKEYHVAVRLADGVAYFILYDVSRHEERLHEFQDALRIRLALSFGALILLSIWLSGVLARQVSDLARRVERLEPAQSHAPLAPDYRDTEVITLANALDQYARRVAALVGREKEFTANVSHELRTPITTIKTSAELLATDPGLSERSRARVRAIAASAEHIAELIDALLLLGREAPVEAQDMVDLAELVDDAAAPLRPAIEAKGLRLAVEIPHGAAARVHRTALQLTLSNLLKNAVAYTDRGEIRVRYADGALSVSDTGVGIAAADLPRIFERAFRGQNARAGGTGLGLAIVKRIADRFGWRIDAQSAAGNGTTFRLLLATSPNLHA